MIKLNNPGLYVFEGLDGSGKTTAAQKIALELGAEFMTTPSPAVRTFREEIIRDYSNCEDAKQLFYLSTVFAASSQVDEMIGVGKSVILDRYILSTLAYAAFRGAKLDLDHFGESLFPATATFFFTASLAVRRERILLRGASHEDKETLTAEASISLHREHYKRRDLAVIGRYIEIDTTMLNEEDVFELVLSKVKGITF